MIHKPWDLTCNRFEGAAPEAGLFFPPLKVIQHHVKGLDAEQEFIVFLTDTSSGQMIANKSAWMLVSSVGATLLPQSQTKLKNRDIKW